MNFRETVLWAFDNKEFVHNWERLRKMKLHGKKAMIRFIRDVKDLIWDRIPRGEI
jgi:hypothetical protein